jgi:hypothetical protein
MVTVSAVPSPKVTLPPTLNYFAIYAPPETYNAPVVDEPESVASVIFIPPLKVLLPAKVCTPVVTTPEYELDADGIATAAPAIPFTVVLMVGPALVPLVQVFETEFTAAAVLV